jgi:hypothetical protein
MKKDENSNAKLIKNILTDLYEWGIYVFTEFKDSSPNYNEIVSICNE